MQFQKQPLGPAVVVLMAGGLFSRPVDRQTKPTELITHLLDVAICPDPRIHTALNRCVLCGKSEGVPAHRMQNGIPSHALCPCDHISDHVVPDMTHVQAAGGVGKHRKGIERPLLRFRCLRCIQILLLPCLLPSLFENGGVIAIRQPRRGFG